MGDIRYYEERGLMSPHDILPARIADRIVVDGCWLWQGAKTADGYSSMGYEGRRRYGHRLSYELTYGPIPEGLHIHHHCRVRHCINPEHIEAMTQQRNNLLNAKRRRKTHCRHGHRYTPDNTYEDKDGRWHCLICKRAAQRRWRVRRNAANVALGRREDRQ